MNEEHSHNAIKMSAYTNLPPIGKDIRYCPYCGGTTTIQYLFGSERPTCPRCKWAYFADPKVAAAVLVKQDGKVLLTQRIMEPSKGYWTLPAGFVDAHEDPIDAAERECLEETGLQVKVTKLLNVIAGREHPSGADIVIIYHAVITGGRLQAADDADRTAFFSLDQLPPLAFRSTRSILEGEVD